MLFTGFRDFAVSDLCFAFVSCVFYNPAGVGYMRRRPGAHSRATRFR